MAVDTRPPEIRQAAADRARLHSLEVQVEWERETQARRRLAHQKRSEFIDQLSIVLGRKIGSGEVPAVWSLVVEYVADWMMNQSYIDCSQGECVDEWRADVDVDKVR